MSPGERIFCPQTLSQIKYSFIPFKGKGGCHTCLRNKRNNNCMYKRVTVKVKSEKDGANAFESFTEFSGEREFTAVQ